MSEEILKALMQLFAIISKQDGGGSSVQRNFVESFLTLRLSQETVQEYLNLYDEYVGVGEVKEGDGEEKKEKKLTSVKDSVRTLAICKKINKTLTQKQKVVVLIRLLELVKSDNQFTPQRMQIINTVSTVFNISTEETKIIENFTINEDPYTFESQDILIIDDKKIITLDYVKGINHIQSEGLDSSISIIRINSVGLYFLKYNGKSDIFLNGLALSNASVYLFAPGSTIRLPRGTIYYSDIVAKFLRDKNSVRLSFNARNIEYKFPNGNLGLRNINVSEESGKLVGIMGASGAGKTTLLNVLSGIEKPTNGEIKINGIDISTEKEKIEGVIGYIAQDDLLMEELTVFQNLFYNAKLCFKNLSEEEIVLRVEKTLNDLGLLEIKDVKVGNPLNKKISGGQRKRLNIALELIREPSVLFVDEPTSGLSSRDSENVMDLLKELSLKGKLIFVVIHQPSSDIFKMFDKLFLLDVGGYPIYYGNPIEAVVYFKKVAKQINSDVGECHACGNVNPEILFNIIEAKVVDEYGRYTNERKVSSVKWNELFLANNNRKEVKDFDELPPRSFNIPSKLKQLKIFITRDVLSKISNKQYLLINLLEAPALAFILSFIIRYIAKPNSDEYVFKANENIPAFIFMSIIIALFIGLTVSAEEIFRDKKILKREALLNLSKNSYFLSKLCVLFSLSAIQTILFVLIGNSIIGIKGMYFDYWLVLFSVSCLANVLGLNISATFNSAVTIYILIPLLIIPQMILGGAMFSYDKLNRKIGGGIGVPPIAEAIPSRWAFEALMVNQFKNNKYGKVFYEVEKNESMANYKSALYIPELKEITNESKQLLNTKSDSSRNKLKINLSILRNEIASEQLKLKNRPFNDFNKLEINLFDEKTADNLLSYLEESADFYNTWFNKINEKKNLLFTSLQDSPEKKAIFTKNYLDYFNENLSDLVKKNLEPNKLVRDNKNGTLIQVIDPIYLEPVNNSFRTHFYTPVKYLFNIKLDTFWYNIIIIWILSVLLYITLYFDVLKKILSLSGKFKIGKKNALS